MSRAEKNAARKLAIIGWPVSHSRSPLIHNHWLAAHQINAVYTAYPIDPNDDFKARLKDMAAEGFIGANVTIPHKEAAFAAMDEVSPAAQKLGAVNTISFRDGVLYGANTDGDGFLAGLDDAVKVAPEAMQDGSQGAAKEIANWRKSPALVLGAGGAARAIIAALGRAGLSDIRLVNRTREKAEALCGLADGLSIGDWQDRHKSADGCGVLVNTTSLGMDGQPPLDMSLSGLSAKALVSDIVYTPLITPLLSAAQASGHIGVDGLGMLMHQAALSFEIWFGEKPAVDKTLRDLLLADLGAVSDAEKNRDE